MNRTLRAGSIGLMTLLSFIGFVHLAHAAKEQRTIRVNAQSELQITPDVVDLHFTLRTQGKQVSDAVQKLTTMENSVVQALKRAGMQLKHIRISHISLYPNRKYRKRVWGSSRGAYIASYSASKRFIACIQKIEQMPTIIGALAKVNIYSMSTRFRTTKGHKYKTKLRAMAVQAAHKKAKELAQYAGVQLGKVHSIQLQPYPRYGSSPNVSYRRSSRQNTVKPGAITLRIGIQMTYYIR